MDEDYDLVIDLDDEREEIPHGSDRDEEMRPIINKYIQNEDTSMEQHSHKELQKTSVIQSQNSDQNSDDDYIQVIDDDDDYELSVQKLISAANKIGREYLKNIQVKEAKANEMLNNSQAHKSDSINGDITNQIRDHRTLHKLFLGRNQDSKDESINRVLSCVRENRIAETTSYKPSYESQYVTEDILHHRNENTFKRRTDGYMQDVRTLPNIQTARHAYRYLDSDRSKVDLSIGDYYPIMDRYEHRHAHRPELPLRNDFYRHDPINRYTHFHVQRPTLNTNGCRYNAMPRETHNHHYIPEDMLSIDEYRRAEINRAPQFYPDRPDLIRLNDYKYTSIERDASTYYAYRPHELLRSDYDNTITNGFPDNHYMPDHALDDYWQAMSRHAYRPEGVISMEDYERSLSNWHVYNNAYKPPIGLSLDPCRLVEFPHIYRPDLVNMDTCREPMLTRKAFYPETEGMYCYKPRINPYKTEIYDANGNDNFKLNVSRKQEITSTAANTPRNASKDDNKLQSILSTGNKISKAQLHINQIIEKPGNLDVPVYKYKNSLTYRTMEDHIKSNKTTLSENKPESDMDICKPGVPVMTNRPDTVILSTKHIYQKRTYNQNAQSDALAASGIIRDTYDKIETTAKEIENHGAALDKNADFIHKVNKTHEEKGADREGNAVEKDISIQLLVVFFTRVKELVKDTFPEFSKSLEKEIDNLGKRTNSGRLKTDIQYICPLYCSVSTYSLPRFDSTDDDNRVEKHVNRAKICDVCSCIQNCYKLYKTKYFNLVFTQTGEGKEKRTMIGNDTVKVNMPQSVLGIRAQTVIRRRQGTDCKESKSNQDILNIDEELNKNQGQSITDHKILNKDTRSAYSTTVNNKLSIAGLHDTMLLDSLSVLNGNLTSKNIENAMNSPNWVPTISIDDNDISLRINTHNNRMEIEKQVLKTVNDEKEIIIDYSSQSRQSLSENRVNKDNCPKDENEAKLILSLSFNEITNADIIASKLKDKISKKPDTVFTCHICSCTFTYFTSFVSHIQKEHNINEIDEDLSEECIAQKCPFCGVYSKQKYHNEHVEKDHPEIFTRKEEANEIEVTKVNKRRKSMKRKFIFTCLVCHKNLKSCEVQRHREIEHKGLKVAKMFTKKLSSMD
ncbi:uncharacterized protein LOC133532405 [Cydia pomonella]|uniref:uncharacterized protein LOC133532405 n=1 Tax=Cydia pomonella TaxID=82600 RepID=UPI002ADE4952|nr:uncharacterized protein LOC133532405 [Cydia pomonella]